MKKFIVFLFCLTVFMRSGLAQNFYDVNTIQSIEVFFGFSNWDYRMDTAKAGSEGYVLADSVRINGITYDSVGVKYKGNSSYGATRAKNPLHIELDYVRNQNYLGYTDVKLGNGYSDPSMIREVLSYRVLKNYMHCPEANFATVYVNGTQLGLYTNVEAINKSFVENHFYAIDKTIVKCNPKTVATTAATSPSLTYLGTDSTLYYNYYEIKSDYGWQDLIDLTDTLKNYFSSIENIMDIDRAIWMLSFNNVLVNLDSYSGNFRQNYYEVKDASNRFSSVVWDLNMSFAGFSMAGSGPPLSVSGAQNLTPTLHMGDNNWPLINKILADARYKRMYIAHMRTIANENFASGSYLTDANFLRAIVDTPFYNDPNKFFTNTQFDNAMSTAVTSGPMTIPGIQQLMDARATYLSGTTEFGYVPPTITLVTATPSSPAITTTATITATITNATYAYLGYRYNFSNKFTKVQMLDDGMHGDGAAGDNVYGADLPIDAAVIQYYVYADNSTAGMFSPERAEHEFYTLYATVPTINPGDVVINELMSVNVSTVNDPEGQFDDWIEFYNNTTNYLDLGNLFLSDNYATPFKWDIPENTLIAPNSFLIVWADNDVAVTAPHANFKLGSAGEELTLSTATGTVIDSVTFPALVDWVSYGRFPNGTGSFTTMFPTHNATNSLVGIAETKFQDDLKFFPNPTNGTLNLILANTNIDEVQIMDLTGKLVYSISPSATTKFEVDMSGFENGVYLIQVNQKFSGRIIKI